MYSEELETMKLWMRKIAVVLVAIMTLGMYVPQMDIHTNAENNKDALSSKGDHLEDFSPKMVEDRPTEATGLSTDSLHIDALKKDVKAQTYTKLGPRISERLDDQFLAVIIKEMETVVETLVTEEDHDFYFEITQQPTEGFGEKIFSVYDLRTNEDIARFDVRRDNRPLEGYWFNFHYHLQEDNFVKHHEIGEIFWDKNTPPKWMA